MLEKASQTAFGANLTAATSSVLTAIVSKAEVPSRGSSATLGTTGCSLLTER
jgi:hypothetical protein